MSDREFYLKILESAIFIKEKCKARHRETVFVREASQGNETAWTGCVEVFDLEWHETALQCYAWVHISENEPPKIFALARNHIIDSPQRAVQAAIFTDAQPLIPPASVSSMLNGRGTFSIKSTPAAPATAPAKATVEDLAMAHAA